jgi:hypothetical protein
LGTARPAYFRRNRLDYSLHASGAIDNAYHATKAYRKYYDSRMSGIGKSVEQVFVQCPQKAGKWIVVEDDA